MLTEQGIRVLIGETIANFDASSLGKDTAFTDAGLDSLDHSSILLEIEERFGLKIPDEDVEACGSIQGILHFAATKDKS
jgi:acyl carrier protein